VEAPGVTQSGSPPNAILLALFLSCVDVLVFDKIPP
jgi:hypothetical protein